MKRIWMKMIILASGIITLMGINPSPVQATIHYNKQIAEVSQISPLYLKLGADIISNFDKQKPNAQLVQHYSHSSHVSHRSHHSHYSG